MAVICVPYIDGRADERNGYWPDRSARARPGATKRRPARTSSRGLRRYLPGAATLVTIGAVWLGAGALASHGGSASPVAAVPATAASSLLVAGQTYVVKAGDTLRSIALRLDPSADPASVIALLHEQLHGGQLEPGLHIALP